MRISTWCLSAPLSKKGGIAPHWLLGPCDPTAVFSSPLPSRAVLAHCRCPCLGSSSPPPSACGSICNELFVFLLVHGRHQAGCWSASPLLPSICHTAWRSAGAEECEQWDWEFGGGQEPLWTALSLTADRWEDLLMVFQQIARHPVGTSTDSQIHRGEKVAGVQNKQHGKPQG